MVDQIGGGGGYPTINMRWKVEGGWGGERGERVKGERCGGSCEGGGNSFLALLLVWIK